jgi:hypothetical protein
MNFNDLQHLSSKGYIFHHHNGQIYKMSQLTKMMKSGIKRKLWTEEEFKNKLPMNVKPIQAWEVREGKKHDLSCSHAKEDICNCWCCGKYHQNTKGILTSFQEIQSKESVSQ